MRSFKWLLLVCAGLPLIRQSTAFPIREAQLHPDAPRKANTTQTSGPKESKAFSRLEITKVLCNPVGVAADPFTQCLAKHICDPSWNSEEYNIVFNRCQTELLNTPRRQYRHPPSFNQKNDDSLFGSKTSLRRRKIVDLEAESTPTSFSQKFKGWHNGIKFLVVLGFIVAGSAGFFLAMEVMIILGIIVELVVPFLLKVGRGIGMVIEGVWDLMCRGAQWYRRTFAWPQYLFKRVIKPLHARFLQLLYKEWPIIGQLKDPHPELKPYRELVEKNWAQRRSRVYKVAMDDSHKSTSTPGPSQEMTRSREQKTEVSDKTETRQICVICVEELPLTEFPRQKITKKCRHRTNACLNCVAREIRRTLEISVWSEAGCIGENCRRKLSRDAIAAYAFKEDVDKLDRLDTIRALETNKSFRWCSNESCTEGGINEDGLLNPETLCKSTTCATKHCFIHHTTWHGEQTCKEYQREIDGTYSELTTAEMNAKPHVYGVECPGCGVRIFRISGCANMVCSLCQRSFHYTGPAV